jgi:hypothetical protein
MVGCDSRRRAPPERQVPKLKRQADEVLKVFHRLNARPGDCLHYVTMLRNGLAESDLDIGVGECARLGQVVAREDCAELTEIGWRAIGWARPKPGKKPALP